MESAFSRLSDLKNIHETYTAGYNNVLTSRCLQNNLAVIYWFFVSVLIIQA